MRTMELWLQLVCILLLNLNILQLTSTVVGTTSFNSDELDDFDFTVVQRNSDQLPLQLVSNKRGVVHGVVKMAVQAATGQIDDTPSNFIPLAEDWQDEYDETATGVHNEIFTQREKLLRQALTKALSNAALRQRFVEVMPILRVLNSQQRLALSALITAQLNAKENQTLKLEEVRQMFGDDKQLLLPIMFDIANLVSSSAFNYLPSKMQIDMPAERRELELNSAEQEEENYMIGIATELADEVLDPQAINEKLMELPHVGRQKRSLDGAELAHKLVRAVPISTLDEEELQRGLIGARMLNINMTAFETPTFEQKAEQFDKVITEMNNSPSYQQVEDLAFANLNSSATEDFITEIPDSGTTMSDELLPQPEGLIAGPRYRHNTNKVRLVRPKPLASRKRVQVQQAHPKSGQPATNSKKCERFTASMCIRTDDYPLEQIMGSIRRHKNAMTALLAEYHESPFQGAHLEEEFGEFIYNSKRREDEGGTGGGMCQSIVRYARPQKAKSASGEWKFIVNTGQHTQTLRLEKCSHPQESCSYLTHQYRSHCTQVYNYHRLLSWDKTRGLHVDIFKVPTCCTCQVDGYRQQYPPLAPVKENNFTPSHLESYSTINEELDYNDEEDEDDLNYNFGNGGYSKLKGREPHDFDANELQSSSKNVHMKVFPPNPTVGSYLSPPGQAGDPAFGYQSTTGITGNKVSKNLLPQHTLARRRPYKSLTGVGEDNMHEGRVDLEISPSELHAEKEVKQFGSIPPKQRKPIYSVPHTAAAAAAAASASGRYSTRVRIPSTSSRPFTEQTTGGRNSQQTANTATSYATHGGSRGSRKPQSTRYSNPSTAKTSTRASATGTTTSGTSTSPATINSSTTTTQSASFNVNAMYSAKLNSSNASKRINYNYHPIIDFFEVNPRHAFSTTTSTPVVSSYAHTIPKAVRDPHVYQSHERRIGFGALGSPAFPGNTNDWKPLVVAT